MINLFTSQYMMIGFDYYGYNQAVESKLINPLDSTTALRCMRYILIWA